MFGLAANQELLLHLQRGFLLDQAVTVYHLAYSNRLQGFEHPLHSPPQPSIVQSVFHFHRRNYSGLNLVNDLLQVC